jgi:hypothetical protein
LGNSRPDTGLCMVCDNDHVLLFHEWQKSDHMMRKKQEWPAGTNGMWKMVAELPRYGNIKILIRAASECLLKVLPFVSQHCYLGEPTLITALIGINYIQIILITDKCVIHNIKFLLFLLFQHEYTIIFRIRLSTLFRR